jgi:hypothetical protein
MFYLLDVAYDPEPDVLEGDATIRARATQDLSSFNLDLDWLTVESVKVDGRRAGWTQDGSELIVTPRTGLRDRWSFTTVARYAGIPKTLESPWAGVNGFIHTDDGAVVVGQPHVAATWYPVNDHPSDKAAYTFRITVPAGLEAVANGTLEGVRTKRDRTTWTWDAEEPMASYLSTAAIGEFDLRAYKEGGVRYWDAIDADLLAPPAAPRTGEQFAISQTGQPSFKRLTRTITVPASGASLSFWITRSTEPNWDFAFVEAHTAGEPDWTTLPDLNGHTSEHTGSSCPAWLGLHPFLAAYQTDSGDGTCSPGGTSGHWWAASGPSDGWEQWVVDLSAFAGTDVEVSITYASDDFVQWPGVFVDDIVVSSGPGTTSFEDDGNTMDGWTVPGAPEGSPPNPNDWIAGTVADTPPPLGAAVETSLARQGEIVDFLSGMFGRYPFSSAGAIVDDDGRIQFALETQTRSVYSYLFFTIPGLGDSIVVHELAHQWYGNSLTLAQWQHVWLHEGFAVYAEWLWAEREGFATTQDSFDAYYFGIPEDDPFWALTIGDPGPDALFDDPVYLRGAMTLQQLRVTVGDDDFFRILRKWARARAGENVTTDDFVELAERISGQDLGPLFEAWLFMPGRPALPETTALRRQAAMQAPGVPLPRLALKH